MGDRRARHCSSYRCWRRGLAYRRWHSCRWKRASSIAANFRRSWTREGGTLAISRRCSLSLQGIVKNDPEAIRAAAKSVPDLQASGRDGATLLNFAVRQSWQRPESVEAVRTLLSLGADPNYTNEKPKLSRDGRRRAFVGARPPLNVGGRRKCEYSR